MVDFRHYQILPHTHPHYCPACQLELTKQDEMENSDTQEFSCDNTNCPVIICYCNGTLEHHSVTLTEFLRCAEDILTIINAEPEDVFYPTPTSFEEIGGQIRSHLNSMRDGLTVKNEIAAEQRFETLARLERTLERRDEDALHQVPDTGERVLNFNGVYIPHSEILVYTVVTDEFDEPRMVKFPVKDATYLDKEETEPFELDIEQEVRTYFGI